MAEVNKSAKIFISNRFPSISVKIFEEKPVSWNFTDGIAFREAAKATQSLGEKLPLEIFPDNRSISFTSRSVSASPIRTTEALKSSETPSWRYSILSISLSGERII